MMTELYDTSAAIAEEAKAEVLPYAPKFMGNPGQAIHEHSTCRMGADPKHSALNGFAKCTTSAIDGAAFTSGSEKNPTLTILPLGLARDGSLAAEMKSRRL